MHKYQEVFFQQFDRTIGKWQSEGSAVHESEVYRLLHTIKGSAAIIGLPEWTDKAIILLQQIDEEGGKVLSLPEITQILVPLLHLRAQAAAKSVDLQPPKTTAAETEEAVMDSVSASIPLPSKPLVLLVDDDLALLQLYKEHLEMEDCMVLATLFPDKAVQWFYDFKPDCIVMGVLLLGQSGYQLLNLLQDRSGEMIVPVILMSAQHDKSDRIMAYALGADDFLAKPIDPDEFTVRVMNKIRRKQAIGKYMLLDELTGLYNAPYLRKEWERYSHESLQNGTPLYAAMLDIDHFRDINQRFGHAEGDAFLAQTAAFLKDRLLPDELLIRWEKDRFLLLSKGLRPDQAKQRWNDLIQRFAEHTFEAEGLSVSKSFCLIYEQITVQQGLELHEAHWSDAMKQAKLRGPGTVLEADAELEKGPEVWRIAILDDDPIIRNMLHRRLRDLELDGKALDIRTFGDGSVFFEDEWHRQTAQYLVILDRMMPKINGLEVLARLRAGYPADRYRIIMLTGVGEEEEIAKAMRLGIDDYVVKPFRLQELEARLLRILQGKRV
ncbi:MULTISPECIES: response regulator [unclassified Paenibacillus]|uniref:response regulator n=1 Tax=unclassified Paenibacillus TaxID=185978 RepID=UPI001AE135D7|nr:MULTISPECIES: response regulator [unclassified Paenibacillus]MBP1154929.1 diguanylate cyclase (GGDEF)-like protein [Paenibacillus sp. PvP091]MBP1169687.1 diguanylate cyclase (GGDEF)-like protein [Paenibacillus sp. PvR098]MBP2440715.1 diguanylate cyclase (GGDEF)-like protein [Paenibacillus sp. PvP052]